MPVRGTASRWPGNDWDNETDPRGVDQSAGHRPFQPELEPKQPTRYHSVKPAQSLTSSYSYNQMVSAPEVKRNNSTARLQAGHTTRAKGCARNHIAKLTLQ